MVEALYLESQGVRAVMRALNTIKQPAAHAASHGYRREGEQALSGDRAIPLYPAH